MSWNPRSWRNRPATQLPAYPDPVALEMIETCLASAPPLASVAESRQLSADLAEVASGRGFLLQGGDCAESFAEFGADKVRLTFNLLLEMAAGLRPAGGGPVVKVARMAGQFAKPRSADTETIEGVTLPVYRGDIVNGPDFDAESRTPDPMRMLEAHRQSRATVDLLKAYAAAAYAERSHMHRSARGRMGLSFDHHPSPGDPDHPLGIFTSHESLLLPYEQALTGWDEASESWWSRSAHMVWLGDRTRQLDGAHVEYASGIANTVGLKCGPSLGREELLRLVDRLDPGNRPGRLVLIGRFGAAQAERCLAPLMRATRRAGRNVIWAVDPMHGNTVKAGAHKTRLLADILSETRTFFEVAGTEAVHARGIHLELTGCEVTECIGGSVPVAEADLARRYLSHCDPRLNRSQALDVIGEVARLMRAGTRPASHAA